MRTLLLFVAVSGVGCGGLDPQFAGVWTGTMVLTVTVPGSSSPGVQSNPAATVLIEEAAGAYSLSVCNGVAHLPLEGVGGRATWSGIQACSTPFDDCASATIIFRSAEGTLSSGKLSASLKADGAACGSNATLRYEFSGTK